MQENGFAAWFPLALAQVPQCTTIEALQPCIVTLLIIAQQPMTSSAHGAPCMLQVMHTVAAGLLSRPGAILRKQRTSISAEA